MKTIFYPLRYLTFGLSILALLLPLTPHAQSKEYNKTTAELIPVTKNWQSKETQYMTNDLDIEQPVGSCYNAEHNYGKWLKFKANKSNIEIQLKTGGKFGTMQFPYIYLFDEQFQELVCAKYSEDAQNDFLTIVSTKLVPSKYYYIFVCNHNNAKYMGTFSLCVNDSPSNDNKDGAVEIPHLNKWCTPEVYSTLDGLPDEYKMSCMEHGPNYNKWFTFKATTANLEIEVHPRDIEGKFQFPYMALYDDMMKEVACAKYSENTSEHVTKIATQKLTPGKRYYLSVDHVSNASYTGSFQVCFNDGTNKLEQKFYGKVFDDKGPKKGERLTLYTQNNTPIISTITDNQGQVLIPYVNTPIYTVKLLNSGSKFQGFIAKHNDEVYRKSWFLNGQYIFENLNPNCNKLSLLDCSSTNFKANPNKSGIVGKVVDKKNPLQNVGGVVVNIYNADKKIIKNTTTSGDGDFQVNDLDMNKEYFVKVTTPKKEDVYSEMLYVNDQGAALKSTSSKDGLDENGFFHFEYLPMVKEKMKLLDEELDVHTDLSAAEAGRSIVLNNLYFKANSSELMKSSDGELENLYNTLKVQANIKIEIMGFTDNVGADDVNITLSTQRAKSVADYLISKGLDKTRISYKGYGKNMPIADNATEEGRNKNRRVEVKIIK